MIPMEPGNGMASHARGSWFDAGGAASGGGTPGKRPEYDTLAVSLVGFAVGAAMPGAACQPASSCVECMEGSYSSVSAATHCDLCAANATSPVGSTSASACVCKPGFEGDGRLKCSEEFILVECNWNTLLPCAYEGCIFDKTADPNALTRSGDCSGHGSDLYLNSKGIELLPAGVFDGISPQ